VKRIAWVDEDERIWAPERNILIGLGQTVDVFADASTAFDVFMDGGISRYELVILDVMLLQGENEDIFSDAATKLGRDTGLVLARRICEKEKEMGRRILFFTRATDPPHVALIEATSRDLGAYYLRKSQSMQAGTFVKFLLENNLIKRPSN
jgi:DNA-binding response OmpR family regulator